MKPLAVLAIFLLSAPTWAAPTLILPGDYHAEEVVDATPGPWLALLPGEGEDQLVETPVAVEPVPDPIFGDDEKGTSGRRVSTPGLDGQALFLLRGIEGLRAGTVTTVVGEPRDLAREAPLRMFLGSAEQNRIEFDCQPDADAGAGLRCALRYSRGEHQQILGEFRGSRDDQGVLSLGDDANPSLLWAGDLDRDGRLDLLFDLSDHYNVSLPTLFLSTRAGTGELVGRVAERRTVGC